jgi:hypothetical protein
MSEENSVVAIYHTHAGAEEAVRQLQHSGVNMHKLSIIGKGYHADEQSVSYYNTGDRAKYWGKVGAYWGGVGPILAGGPVVAWIVAALEGAADVGVLGALGAGLHSIGISKDSIVKYKTALESDQYLLIAHGTVAEVAKAKDIIGNTDLAHCTIHVVNQQAA